MYQVEVKHDGLKKFRVIRGQDRYVVQQKAAAQRAQWEEMWERRVAVNRKSAARQRRAQEVEGKKAAAVEATEEAQARLDWLENLLTRSLAVNDAIDWDTLKDHSVFAAPRPKMPAKPTPPGARESPVEPMAGDEAYRPKLTFFDRLFPYRCTRKEEAADAQFKADHAAWRERKAEFDRGEVLRQSTFQADLKDWGDESTRVTAAWEAAKAKFEKDRAERNAAVDRDREEYRKGTASGIIDYCDLVLTRSEYPDTFPKSFDLDFETGSGTLFVTFKLPAPDDLPRLKEVRYVVSRDELQETLLAERTFNALYESVVYQVVLRSVHELFEADLAKVIRTVIFNGQVDCIDGSTGRPETRVILAVKVGREQFEAVDLARVDPEAWFRGVGGVGGKRICALEAVRPMDSPPQEEAEMIAMVSGGRGREADLTGDVGRSDFAAEVIPVVSAVEARVIDLSGLDD